MSTISSPTWVPTTAAEKPVKILMREGVDEIVEAFSKLCDPNVGHVNNHGGIDPNRDFASLQLIQQTDAAFERGYVSRQAQISALTVHNRHGDRSFVTVNAAVQGGKSYHNEAYRLMFKTKQAIELFVNGLAELGFIYYPYHNDFYKFNSKNMLIGVIEIERKITPGETESIFDFDIGVSSHDEMRQLEALLLECFNIRPKDQDREEIITIDDVDERKGFITSSSVVRDTDMMATPSFYPWMKGLPIQEYFSDFMSSRANVMILFGIPGTGKSTMIRTAIKLLRLKVLLTSNPKVMTSAGFINFCGKRLSAGAERRFDMLVAEDADALMTPRKEGNLLMQMLLNATSGIVSDNQFKIILTTNETDLTKFDPALLRAGRCYDAHEFGAMNAEQAMQVRADLKMPPLKLKEGAYTVAQATNISHTGMLDYAGNQIVQPRFGFRTDDKINRK